MAGKSWLWVSSVKRWRECTLWEAGEAWVYHGIEIAWGMRAPKREGVPPAGGTTEQRREVWGVYLEQVTSSPVSRSRIGSVSCHN